jgi:hypothetical protein
MCDSLDTSRFRQMARAEDFQKPGTRPRATRTAPRGNDPSAQPGLLDPQNVPRFNAPPPPQVNPIGRPGTNPRPPSGPPPSGNPLERLRPSTEPVGLLTTSGSGDGGLHFPIPDTPTWLYGTTAGMMGFRPPAGTPQDYGYFPGTQTWGPQPGR